MNHIFLLRDVYVQNSQWTLFGRNVFRLIVKEGVYMVDLTHPLITYEVHVPLSELPTEDYLLVNDEEISLALLLYWEPVNPNAT